MSMSMPPPMFVTQLPLESHGSVGPFVVAFVVVVILGAAAIMIGRMCSGRRMMGYGQYDMESWAEEKCATCIDGVITTPSPPPRPPSSDHSNATPSLASTPSQAH